MEAARAALHRGRKGARGGDVGVAKDGAAQMASKEREAGVLRGEARTYRHEATTMQIQAETQGDEPLLLLPLPPTPMHSATGTFFRLR